MNGRIYDPVIGRFISADPNVYYPENPQDFNRYSYVQNNPLSMVDPSGFMLDPASDSLLGVTYGAPDLSWSINQTYYAGYLVSFTSIQSSSITFFVTSGVGASSSQVVAPQNPNLCCLPLNTEALLAACCWRLARGLTSANLLIVLSLVRG